ncbi:phosphatidylserine decarboxylase [Puniceicoccales bacterium CK1056]|uniref:Phosphatidylserine decarboxylase n=1 Tax=Oceanipulchritudo coccoides TaxID=2706888 RepID=A0A6B2M2M0_9BACT|nr:phosphatidylserine decarboxylase [Oceanipulchritudo coccoides]NDV62572.1 phosphatidylserine decarboxylase [Oceanipulchritudo coccoides]
MRGEPIEIFDRYTGQELQEAVYGESSLRLVYETSVGRAGAACLFSRPFISRLFGWYMKRPASAKKVRPFVKRYGLNEAEFSRPLDAYESFNAFFCRELHPEARPVDADPDSVVFPADARHLGFQELGSEERVFVKGQSWDLGKLLGGDAELIRRFSGGSLVLSRLCPVDYHHFHYPASGTVESANWLGQRLYSVSPIALRQRLAYLWENLRYLTRIKTDSIGEVCFIEVGATNVGSIQHRPLPPDGKVTKGEPKGWFEFGGSSVITLFEPGKVILSDDLITCSAKGIELYARCGDKMGIFSR